MDGAGERELSVAQVQSVLFWSEKSDFTRFSVAHQLWDRPELFIFLKKKKKPKQILLFFSSLSVFFSYRQKETDRTQ